MWRFLQGIPRAVRGQWRSAPQTVCREDENELYRGHVGLVHGPHAVRASATICTKASTLGIHGNPRPEGHQHGEDPTSSKHEEGPREGPREEEQGARFSAQGERPGGQGPDRDQWFHEWLESFRHDCYAAFSEKQHSVLEAVGWGSALLLGTQFAHYQGMKHGNRRNEDNNGYCPLQNIYRCALAMPALTGSAVVKTILPQTQKQKKPFKSDSELEVQGEGELTFLHDRILVEEAASPGRPAVEPEETLQNDEAFSEADEDWRKLTTTYKNVSHNAQGYQLAQVAQYRRAVPLWKRASEAGYAKAHFNLGLCYELGKGVDKDLSTAVEYYRLAATDGHPKGLYNLGVMYLQGGGGLNKDPRHALDLLESAAMQGLRRAQTELGVLYTEEERLDMKKAASLFQMAALQEDPTGQYYLGICYENGWGIERNECKAADLYKKASDGGHAAAAYNLGVFFENGLGGLPEDESAARDMYMTSAQLGNQEAEKEATRLTQDDDDGAVEDPIFQLDLKLGKSTISGQQPVLSGSASSPAFSDYICKHLLDFGFGDLDVTEAMFGARPKVRQAKQPVIVQAPKARKSQQQLSPHIKVTETSGAEVKFYLGDEDDDVGVPDVKEQKPVFTDAQSGSLGNNGWLLGGSFGDSGYSSFNGGSRSCSLNELSQARSSAHDVHLVSCT